MPAALEMRVQSSDLAAMYKALKAAESQLTVELRRGVKNAAKPLEAAVKAAAPSANIRAAVTTKLSFSGNRAGVKIIADAKKAPEAAPINNGGKGGTFRHPVFGTDIWVDQQAVPFFDAPIRAHYADADKAMLAVLDTIGRKAGFR